MEKGRVLSKREHVLTWVIFGIYLFVLSWLILFKLADSIDKIPHMRGMNLIPFYYKEKDGINLSHSLIHFREVFDNILLFIPAGYYVMVLTRKQNFFTGSIRCFALSFLFETLQFVFALGISDITDLITNTCGGIIGIGMFVLFRKLFKDKHLLIVNCIGGVMELSGIALLFLLIITNS